MTIDKDNPPPPSGDTYERGLDPWHRDAFAGVPITPNPGMDGHRREGWYAIDWCGNVVGWYADGTEVATAKEAAK